MLQFILGIAAAVIAVLLFKRKGAASGAVTQITSIKTELDLGDERVKEQTTKTDNALDAYKRARAKYYSSGGDGSA